MNQCNKSILIICPTIFSWFKLKLISFTESSNKKTSCFSLLFLSMIKAQKHFNINTEKILNKMSPTNNFLYNYFKENYKD